MTPAVTKAPIGCLATHAAPPEIRTKALLNHTNVTEPEREVCKVKGQAIVTPAEQAATYHFEI
eukprot:5042276-Prorocentrum_lima.AAC.1